MELEADSLKPAHRYFLMVSCIVPRPIAWVATLNEDLSPNLAPISFFNGASATPPTVVLGIGPSREKPEKDTLRNLRRSGELTISIPGLELAPKVEATGAELPYGRDEFEEAGLTPLPGRLVGPPRVAEAGLALECVVDRIIPLGRGGSNLVLAEVKMFHVDDGLLDQRGCVDPARFRALARMGGGLYASVGQVFKVGDGEER